MHRKRAENRWAAISGCRWNGDDPYLDRFVTIDDFFVRKVMLFKYSYAFIMLPGGFGTMDEFFEALTLSDREDSEISAGRHGDPILEQAPGTRRRHAQARNGHAADTKLLFYTDSVEEAAAFIAAAVQEFGISSSNPLKILGESPLRKEPAHHPTTRG